MCSVLYFKEEESKEFVFLADSYQEAEKKYLKMKKVIENSGGKVYANIFDKIEPEEKVIFKKHVFAIISDGLDC